MDKVLVTGGAGFIGSHLVARLVEKGYEVRVADILLRGNKIEKNIFREIRFHKTDVRDKEKIEKLAQGCRYIFHLAAVLGVDVVAQNPVETMETESMGMKNITHAAQLHDVEKIIYASTSGVYGHATFEKSVTEDIELNPSTSYSIAKRFNEIYLTALYEEKGMQSVSLRYFNIYGIRQDNRMVIPRFQEQAMKNKPLTVFGSGKQSRDFTYIDDTVFASIELAEKINGCEIFNIANEKEVTIAELAEKVIKICGSTSKISHIKTPKKRIDYEVLRRYGNCDKMFNAIGYRPDTTLDKGLRVIFNYLKSTQH